MLLSNWAFYMHNIVIGIEFFLIRQCKITCYGCWCYTIYLVNARIFQFKKKIKCCFLEINNYYHHKSIKSCYTTKKSLFIFHPSVNFLFSFLFILTFLIKILKYFLKKTVLMRMFSWKMCLLQLYSINKYIVI